MTGLRSLLALLLTCSSVAWPVAAAQAQQAQAQQAQATPPLPPQKRSSGFVPKAYAAPAPPPAAPAAVLAPPPPVIESRPLANLGVLHIELLPPQGDAEKCGLEPQALQTAAAYPIAASARLKLGPATLAHMHVRLSAVYVRRLEHCIVHADVRVSSLQQVELAHSRSATTSYVPLWEKVDIRLVPRAQAARVAQERLKQISEAFVIDWAAQN